MDELLCNGLDRSVTNLPNKLEAHWIRNLALNCYLVNLKNHNSMTESIGAKRLKLVLFICDENKKFIRLRQDFKWIGKVN